MGRPLNSKYFANQNVGDAGGNGVASVTMVGAGSSLTQPAVTFTNPDLGFGVLAVGHAQMAAVSATVPTSGSGAIAKTYVKGDILTEVGGTGTPATFSVSTLKTRSVAVAAQGNGLYVTGDTVTLSATGWTTPAVFTLTVAAGVITAVALTDAGVWNGAANPVNPVTADSTTSAAGVGATFTLALGVNEVALVSEGLYDTVAANPVATTSNSATGVGATLTVTYKVKDVVVTVSGSGYTAPPTVGFSTGGASATAVLSANTEKGIEPLAWVPVSGLAAKVADIVKQKSSNRFLVTTVDGTGICTLVAAAPTIGQMSLTATDSVGGTYYVEKITAHKVTVVPINGVQFPSGSDVKWTLGAPVLNNSVQLASA